MDVSKRAVLVGPELLIEDLTSQRDSLLEMAEDNYDIAGILKAKAEALTEGIALIGERTANCPDYQYVYVELLAEYNKKVNGFAEMRSDNDETEGWFQGLRELRHMLRQSI